MKYEEMNLAELESCLTEVRRLLDQCHYEPMRKEYEATIVEIYGHIKAARKNAPPIGKT